MIFFQIYLIIGILLGIASYAPQNKMPNPGEAIVCVLLWPVLVYYTVKSVVTGRNIFEEWHEQIKKAKSDSESRDQDSPPEDPGQETKSKEEGSGK